MNLNQQIVFMRVQVKRMKSRSEKADFMGFEYRASAAVDYCCALAVLETLTQLRGLAGGSDKQAIRTELITTTDKA